MKRIRREPTNDVVEDPRSRRTLNPAQFGFITDAGTAPAKYDAGAPSTVKVQPDAPLHTTQTGISGDDVTRYVENPKAVPFNAFSLRPTLINHEGTLWVHDGHHRIAAARQNGKAITATVYPSLPTDK